MISLCTFCLPSKSQSQIIPFLPVLEEKNKEGLIGVRFYFQGVPGYIESHMTFPEDGF